MAPRIPSISLALAVAATTLAVTAVASCGNKERNSSLEHMNQGVELAQQKSWARATKELEAATSIYRENHTAWYNLGQVHLFQKKWNEAADAFAQAVKYSDQDAMYHYMLGKSLFESWDAGQGGSLALAQTSLEKAVSLNPRLYKAHWYLGRVYHRNDEAAGAARAWTEACRLEPHFGKPFIDLGQLYLRWDFVGQAIAVLEQGTLGHVVDPQELTEIYYNLGLAYDSQKNWAKAVQAYTDAIAKRKDNLDARLQRAFSFHRMGEKAKARADLEEYVQQRKGSADLQLQTANDLLMRLVAE
jgi:Tfp pilus assembly protein PilF